MACFPMSSSFPAERYLPELLQRCRHRGCVPCSCGDEASCHAVSRLFLLTCWNKGHYTRSARRGTLFLRVQLAIHGRAGTSLIAGVACPEIGARESFTVVAGDAAPHLICLEAVRVVRGRLLVESHAIASDCSGCVARVETKHRTSPQAQSSVTRVHDLGSPFCSRYRHKQNDRCHIWGHRSRVTA